MTNLAKACELSLNDWLETFPDIIPEAECSKKHEKWKKNLFNKMRDDHYHRFTTRTIKVMLVAAILCALLLTAFVIPSSREFILDNLDHFSRYKVTDNNKNYVALNNRNDIFEPNSRYANIDIFEISNIKGKKIYISDVTLKLKKFFFII